MYAGGAHLTAAAVILIGMIPAAKHLSVLVKAHETIGPWIADIVQDGKV